MKRKIKQRDLAQISNELQTALQGETRNIIAIGELLIEAKEHVDYGEWLPWLEANFGSSINTAGNYMNAARLSARFPTVGNLKLRPSAMYLLGNHLDDDPDTLFSPAAIKAVLQAAKTEWINEDRAWKIVDAALPPPPPPDPAAIEEAELRELASRHETDDLLAGPPPELPPAPAIAVLDLLLPPFDAAIETLAGLYTKPLGSFVGTKHEADRLRAIGAFLREVATVVDRQTKAA